jgi:hypothetical protein
MAAVPGLLEDHEKMIRARLKVIAFLLLIFAASWCRLLPTDAD